jgi:hypothetical protein
LFCPDRGASPRPTLYSAPVWYPGAVYRQGVNVLPDKAGILNEE